MSAMMVRDVIAELVVLVGSVVVLIFALFAPRRLQPLSAGVAAGVVGVGVITTVMLLPTAGSQRLTFADTYALDGVAVAAKVIVLGITALVIALSVEWFRSDPRQGEYYALLLMSALGAILLAGATDTMEIVLGMLLSSATGYVLVAYHRKSRRSAEAAVKYYLLGALTNGAMVYGVVLFFGVTATTTLTGMIGPLRSADGLAVVAAFVLVLVGFAFKVGAIPAHAWMPDVADGAPAPVAAFVTAAPKIGALIALARLVSVLPEEATGWRPLIALTAALTMTLGNVAALWQDNIRRLLGWSAVSQTGYALMGIVALERSPLALPALVYFLVAYALGNIAAFAVVIFLHGRTEREQYSGLARSHPWLSAVLAVSFLSFVGIPPLAGFTGKLGLFGAAIAAGYLWLAVLAVLNSVVSLAYYARFLGAVYFADAARPLTIAANRTVAASAVLSAAGLVGFGVGANILFRFLDLAVLLPK